MATRSELMESNFFDSSRTARPLPLTQSASERSQLAHFRYEPIRERRSYRLECPEEFD